MYEWPDLILNKLTEKIDQSIVPSFWKDTKVLKWSWKELTRNNPQIRDFNCKIRWKKLELLFLSQEDWDLNELLSMGVVDAFSCLQLS